jgi:hypothetical protein
MTNDKSQNLDKREKQGSFTQKDDCGCGSGSETKKAKTERAGDDGNDKEFDYTVKHHNDDVEGYDDEDADIEDTSSVIQQTRQNPQSQDTTTRR